jgi:parallel beta-helix repeat protein
VISNNSGNSNGGGVYMKYSSAVFEDCEITGNKALESGGGIASGNSSSPTIRRCVISGNEAQNDAGGGLYSIMGSAMVVDCEVTGNTAGYGGGGLFSGTSSTINILRTLIAGNSSGSIGGGVYSAAGMTMSFCTVADNRTGYYGAGVEVFQGPDNHIYNSIIAFNRESEGIFTISGDIAIRCSDVYGNEGGDYGGSTADMTGPLNISLDPLFCGAAAGDYHLDAASPALDPPDQSCPDVMGAFGVRCGDSADLLFSSVSFDTTVAGAGKTIRAEATVRNGGPSGAGPFRVDFYRDLDVPPAWSTEGDLHASIDTLAPGDSTEVVFDVTSARAGSWRSWLLLDTWQQVTEYNRDNNLSGPHPILWTYPGGVAPERSALREVSPNPFDDETGIVIDLDRRAPSEVAIYDLAGRQLKIWKLPPMGPGRFTLTWEGTTDEGRPVASGVYFLRFKVDGVVEEGRKIVRVR